MTDQDCVVVEIACADGRTIPMPALTSDLPGLVIHRGIYGDGWVIAHLRSTMALAEVDSLEAAADFIGDLAAVDWTKSGNELLADEVAKHVLRTARQTHEADFHGGVNPELRDELRMR